jgi:hypothetical protein
MSRLTIDQNDTITNVDVTTSPTDKDLICIEFSKEWKDKENGEKLQEFNKYQMFLTRDKYNGLAIFLDQLRDQINRVK